MKIYVDRIPEEGLEIIEQLDPYTVLSDFDSQSAVVIKPIDVKAKVIKVAKEVVIDVTLEAPVEYTCSRCLAKFQNSLKKKFSISYEVKQGDVLEVDEDIRQEIILDYPMKIVCKPDCKGLCVNCGQNLNITECDCSKGTKEEQKRGLNI